MEFNKIPGWLIGLIVTCVSVVLVLHQFKIHTEETEIVLKEKINIIGNRTTALNERVRLLEIQKGITSEQLANLHNDMERVIVKLDQLLVNITKTKR